MFQCLYRLVLYLGSTFVCYFIIYHMMVYIQITAPFRRALLYCISVFIQVTIPFRRALLCIISVFMHNIAPVGPSITQYDLFLYLHRVLPHLGEQILTRNWNSWGKDPMQQYIKELVGKYLETQFWAVLGRCRSSLLMFFTLIPHGSFHIYI